MLVDGRHYRTVWWEDGRVRMIDQPQLPHRFSIADMATYQDTARAIRDMTTRGAGAIGAAGALGVAQAASAAPGAGFAEWMEAAVSELRATRPTAQDLFTAIDTVTAAIAAAGTDVDAARRGALAAAMAYCDANAEAGRRIGEHGCHIVMERPRVSTHCNAGWLAFVDWGSALAPIYAAKRAGADPFVFVDETRPRQQGSQLTAWELAGEGVRHAIIADNATGHFLSRGEIDVVIVGADRVARNGDIANKIGTYTSALAAAAAGVPFYVAAPTTTIAWDTPTGADIPIEERSPDEVLFVTGLDAGGNLVRVRTSPVAAAASNPAFDVTPGALIAGIITERGIVAATYEGVGSLRE
jgi:methylthioribose-1-phosphate isomerase